jgi:glycosyltransferase involved in cell wall biosynthesis
MSVYYKEKPEYLQQALKSIWDTQTLKPDEIVIVKDGPLTEELDSIISTFKQSAPVEIIQLEKNVGLGIALSIGIKQCKNEYIARMDSDDISKPNRFENEIKYLNKGYDVVSCWSEFFEEDVSNVISVKKRPEIHKDIVKLSKRRSPICHPATMYKKTAVLKAGNYKHCLYFEDYYLWLRMISTNAKFYNIQDYLYSVRTSKNQFERRGGWHYLKLELSSFKLFYKEGLYSLSDYMTNSFIRIITRLFPLKLRRQLYLLIWKLSK